MTRLGALALPLIFAATSPAQTEPAPDAVPQEPPPLTAQDAFLALQKACGKMSNLQGLHYASSEEQENALTRQIGGMFGGGSNSTDIIGRWSPRTLELEIGESDEIVMHGTRMIARNDEYDWSLRRNRLADGSSMPFVYDPGVFFETMGNAIKGDLELTRFDRVVVRERPMLLLSLTIEGDLAREFAYTGALPTPSEGGGMVILGGMGGERPKAKIQTDLAIYIDPESHLIDRLRVKSYQDSPFGGRVVFQVQGGGEDEDEDAEEEIQTIDENGNRIYKKGLPVRKIEDGQSAMSFTVRFKEHDKPTLPKLSDEARTLLRMR